MEAIYTGVNVGQLTPWHTHGNGWHGLVVLIAQVAWDHTEVDLGGFDTGVTEQGTGVPDVSAAQHGHRDTLCDRRDRRG